MTSTRVVFLDFDGVLNSDAFFARTPSANPERDLDPEAVARLNALVAATDAAVIVTSTWRVDHSESALLEVLRRAGFAGELAGVTPRRSGARGREIDAWLDAHRGWRSFVILDDHDDMERLRKRLVQTRATHGLLDEHVNAARRLLSERVWARWW